MKVSQFVNEFLMGHGGRAFPVLQGEQLVGMVALQDVRKMPRNQWETLTIQDIMTPRHDLEVVNPEEEVSEALRKLSERDVNQVPVVEGGRLVGLLRRQDIIRWLQLQNQSLAN